MIALLVINPPLSLGAIAIVAGVTVLAAGLFVWLIGREDNREYHKGDDE